MNSTSTKLNFFDLQKILLKKNEKASHGLKKIFTNHISDRELVPSSFPPGTMKGAEEKNVPAVPETLRRSKGILQS